MESGTSHGCQRGTTFVLAFIKLILNNKPHVKLLFVLKYIHEGQNYILIVIFTLRPNLRVTYIFVDVWPKTVKQAP